MRTLIATAQLIVLTVVAISIMREFKHADAVRDQRFQLLQSLAAPPPQQPECVIELQPPQSQWMPPNGQGQSEYFCDRSTDGCPPPPDNSTELPTPEYRGLQSCVRYWRGPHPCAPTT